LELFMGQQTSETFQDTPVYSIDFFVDNGMTQW